jgi:hypothetical protein
MKTATPESDRTAGKKMGLVFTHVARALRPSGFVRRSSRTLERTVRAPEELVTQEVWFAGSRNNSTASGRWRVVLAVSSTRYDEALAEIHASGSRRMHADRDSQKAWVWSGLLSSLLPATLEARWFYDPPVPRRDALGRWDIDSHSPWIEIGEETDVERLCRAVSEAVAGHGVPMLDRLGSLEGVLAHLRSQLEALRDGSPHAVNTEVFCEGSAVLAAVGGDLELAAHIFRTAMVRARVVPVETRGIESLDRLQQWLLARGVDVADVRNDLQADGVTGAPRLLERSRAARAAADAEPLPGTSSRSQEE